MIFGSNGKIFVWKKLRNSRNSAIELIELSEFEYRPQGYLLLDSDFLDSSIKIQLININYAKEFLEETS